MPPTDREQTERDELANTEVARALEGFAACDWADPHDALSPHMTMANRALLRIAARRLRAASTDAPTEERDEGYLISARVREKGLRPAIVNGLYYWSDLDPHDDEAWVVDALVEAAREIDADRAPTDEAPEREDVDWPESEVRDHTADELLHALFSGVSSTDYRDAALREIRRRLRQPEPAREREGDGLGSCRICERPTDGVTICRYCDRMMQASLAPLRSDEDAIEKARSDATAHHEGGEAMIRDGWPHDLPTPKEWFERAPLTDSNRRAIIERMKTELADRPTQEDGDG